MNKYVKIAIYVLVAAAIIYGVWYFFFRKPTVTVTVGAPDPSSASDFVAQPVTTM